MPMFTQIICEYACICVCDVCITDGTEAIQEQQQNNYSYTWVMLGGRAFNFQLTVHESLDLMPQRIC